MSKKSLICFSLFFGLLLCLVAGGYRYGVVLFFVFVIVFAGLLFTSYRVYVLLERMGVKFYEIFIKDRVRGYKEASKTVEKTD